MPVSRMPDLLHGVRCSVLVCVVLSCCIAAGCSTPSRGAGAAPQRAEVDGVAALLTGSFSSGAQAAADARFFDIRLRAAPIWLDREGGRWLYVEQAVARALDRPYRQRVYQLEAAPEHGDGAVWSHVYTMPDAARWVGVWADPQRLAPALSLHELTRRAGCSILLIPDGTGRYTGATRGTGCATSLADAEFATSHVILDPASLATWDRGWFADGTQAWGSDVGPYVFDRIQPPM
ncbi:MAG: chromophore lyase CpcT/CpeT [Planctomycetota bacterium]